VHPDQLAKDRPVRVWVQGPRRGARSVRPMPRTPTLEPPPSFFLPLPYRHAESGRVVGTAGPCCGGLGNAGDPCAPVLGDEDGREAAARRRRLKW